MAITAIYETGWELADSRDELTAGAGNYAVSTNPKTGTYCFSLTLASGTGNYFEHTAGISQCRMACHVRHNQTSTVRDLLSLRDGSTNVVRVQWDADSSEWVVLCGATEVARESDVGFATTNTYYHVGVDVKIDGAAGWIYLYRDGNTIVSFTGDTNNGGATFNRLHVGSLSLGASWASTGLLDDLVWFDSTGEGSTAAIPDYRLYALAATGNGNYNQWDGSDGNATDNYLLVDDLPADDDTTYLTTDVADDTESFTMSTFTIPAGFAVEEVIPLAIARKEDSLGTLGLKLGTRLSSTDSLSSTKTLGTGYALVRERQTSPPGGGNWEQADLDGVEVVIEAAS